MKGEQALDCVRSLSLSFPNGDGDFGRAWVCGGGFFALEESC